MSKPDTIYGSRGGKEIDLRDLEEDAQQKQLLPASLRQRGPWMEEVRRETEKDATTTLENGRHL